MTLEERERLAYIAEGHEQGGGWREWMVFLLRLAQRCEAAEQFRDTMLADAGIDSARDATLIEEARKAAARECVELAKGELVTLGSFNVANRSQFAAENMAKLRKAIVASIGTRFDLGIGPMSESVRPDGPDACLDCSGYGEQAIDYGYGVRPTICERCNGTGQRRQEMGRP